MVQEYELNFQANVSNRQLMKLFSQRRHAFPRKLKKALKQCWQIERRSDTMTVTFNCLKKTKHQRKASSMIRFLEETHEMLVPLWDGKYMCYKFK